MDKTGHDAGNAPSGSGEAANTLDHPGASERPDASAHQDSDRKIWRILLIANAWLLWLFLLMDARASLMSGKRHTHIIDPPPAPEQLTAENLEDIRRSRVATGRTAFVKCRVCHNLNAEPRTYGPPLGCILGQTIARSAVDYHYSKPLKEQGAADRIWNLTALHDFISSPKAFAPGTRMPFQGLEGQEDDINAIIHYLAWTCHPPESVVPRTRVIRHVPGSDPRTDSQCKALTSQEVAALDEPAAADHYILPHSPMIDFCKERAPNHLEPEPIHGALPQGRQAG